MKRTVTLLLALCLVLSLCACVGEKTAPGGGETPAPQTAESVPMGEISQTASGARYENPWLDLACDLDGNWYVYSEEEMAQIVGMTMENFDDAEYRERLQNAELYYDFFAARLDGLASINMNYSQPVDGADAMTEERYVQMALPELQKGLEAGGMTGVKVETATMTFAGQEKTGVSFYALGQGVDYYGLQFYFFVEGRVATLTLGTFGTDQTAELARLFYALSAGPQETESAPGGLDTQRGAASLEEIQGILTGDFLFTEEQVNCMSYEMLLGCVLTCDPENGLQLVEDYDLPAITALLNERFFSAVGSTPVRYGAFSYAHYPVTDEIRQETLHWYQEQESSIVAEYGEYPYQRIREETEGYQEFVGVVYTVTDGAGNSTKGVDSFEENGLMIIKSNGRYFWMAFCLFDGLA